MTTAVATLQPAIENKRSVLVEMAGRFGMEASAFEQTLRATVVPKDSSKEQFAAFLLVAKEYELNPLTKEIYAFPTRGGGIQPIVSIDGWCNLINSHPALNGIEFDDHLTGEKVTSITCRIWRKDREKPITVTEYLAECVRSTDTWKQYPRRMLRHKALIQCARYAFGFAGIVDPDEAERMAASIARDVTPKPPAPVDDAPALAPPTNEPEAVETAQPEPTRKPPAPASDGLDIPEGLRRQATQQSAPVAPKAPPMPDPSDEPTAFLDWLKARLLTITKGDPEQIWNDRYAPLVEQIPPAFQEDALGLYREFEARLAP